VAASRFFALLLAAVALTGAAAIGLTTYTQPILGGAPYGELETLITRALHDSAPPLPGPPTRLGIAVIDSVPEHAARPVADTIIAAQPLAWVRAAASRDSSALRAWLGPVVLPTAAIAGDSVHLTVRRIAFEPGCPLFSTLHATFVGWSRMRLRLLRVAASCPALPQEAGR
jgi:hypothetical protein